MTTLVDWEERFVRLYVKKEKANRYLNQLKSKKHRSKILDRLNHQFDFKENFSTLLRPNHDNPESLQELLKKEKVEDRCYVLASESNFDGKWVSVNEGIDELCYSPWGIVLVFPPTPIALYKEEEIGNLYLLKSKNT